MMSFINKKRNKKGFTLVELVVVIAILGILAAIAVPKLTGSRTNAAITAHNANVRTLESAAILAISEGSGAIIWGGTEVVGDKENPATGTGKGWGNYLQSWPTFPTGLVDKELNMEVVATPGTYAKTKIVGTEKYKVVIDSNGGVIVTPGKAE